MVGPFLADLHVHSPYAFACSRAISLDGLATWAKRKGIQLLATGDFTHPLWQEQLRLHLVPDDNELYSYSGVKFVPGTEISCVFRQGGRSRRIHLLVLLPTLDTARELTRRLERFGNLASDGRPTVSLSARDLTELALDCHPDAIVIPAHAWTPWYGVFGSRSGFDSLAECFGDLAPAIRAVESGLSSDPAMNWMVPELDTRSIVSFSDAHSMQRLGRELTAFDAPLGWDGLSGALRQSDIAYTVEFYPEEGKYHYSGHRRCGVAYDSIQLAANGPDCPVCGRRLTLGVLYRVSTLSERPIGDQLGADSDGFVRNADDKPSFVRLIPLQEVVAAVKNVGVNTRTVMREYTAITDAIGSELDALLWASRSDLAATTSEDVADAILRVRKGQLNITPGYDGKYGTIDLSPQ